MNHPLFINADFQEIPKPGFQIQYLYFMGNNINPSFFMVAGADGMVNPPFLLHQSAFFTRRPSRGLTARHRSACGAISAPWRAMLVPQWVR